MIATAEETIELLARSLGPDVQRRETHGSWVLLAGDRAYKVKKPVTLDFLDYGTPERRHVMCRAEVDINRRGAPGTYLGVRSLVPAGHGVVLGDEDDPTAIDYVVEMRRFDEDRTLAAVLALGEASADVVAEVGRRVAGFHQACARVEGVRGTEPIERTIDDNFASLGTLIGDDDAGAQRRLSRAARFAVSFLAARRQELEQRAAEGRVRDGHGDLRAEHVLLGGEHEIVDAIEFDPGLRRIDTGLDVAFLVMDFHAAGREDLAAVLLGAYRSAGGDPGDDALVAFFAAYRAQVRAKVELLRGRSGATLLALADQLAWKARGPLVLAIGGGAATGKTTLAAALAKAAGVPHLSSDVARKRMLGLEPTARAPQSAYSREASEATYRELGQSAARTGSAIVDATFRRRRERDAFRDGLGEGAPVVFVECRAPEEVVRRRAAARLREADRVSDATPDIALHHRHEFEALDEVSPEAHVTIRSDRGADELVAEVADALDRAAGSPQR